MSYDIFKSFSGHPRFLKREHADLSRVCVYAGVEDACLESDLGNFERIVLLTIYFDLILTVVPWRVLRSKDHQF